MKKVFTAVMLCLAAAAFAGEGMWMPQQIPQLASELQKAGLKIDPNRFADLTGDPMGAVISLGGCTASFVSPDGLVVTNHHCGYGSVQFNSTPQRDLITNGYLAKSREEELPGGPGTRVFVTTKIEDVTDRISGKLDAKLSDVERAKTIEAREKTLVSECEQPGGVRCRVASFFEGAQYLRTTQMEIRDVRLVYAPALGIGDFGGEADNWMWPRHTGDFTYLRAYVGKDGKPADYSKDNVPYKPEHFLKVSREGLNPGDFVLVAGYPGRTFRYRTAAEVKSAAEFTYPTTIRYATDINNILRAAGKNNKDVEIRNASRVKGNDNVLKNYTGTMDAFTKGGIIAQRQQREAELAKWIAADPARAKKYSNVMTEMNRLAADSEATRQRDAVLAWLLRSSPMLSQANSLYRLSIERAKKDLEREAGFQERDWPRIAEAVDRAKRTLEPGSDRAGLKYMLEESQKLPSDQRIKALDDAIKAAGSIDAYLDQLYANTKVADLAERKAMFSETTAQLEARNDSMLKLAAALMPLRLESEQKDLQRAGAMTRVRPLYMEALRGMTGGRLYPDANSTLRITFGNVEGYKPRDAVSYAPQTTVSGIVQKNTYSGEFDAPKAEIEAIKANKTNGYVDAQLNEVPVNFLSTVDTTGGNSGSPTLNAKGELVGLLFDGNYEALGSDFVVDPAVTRSIHVDAVYMLWVMDAVDGAHNLLREMGIEPKFDKTAAK
ncbi:MAG TPA: S46 family peptidase [Thermoanaerobaculia bacterium]|nr:S46 family peptidase [Thermoanaerobaculia bacterium]